MYVCLCNAVTDEAIRDAVRQYQPMSLQELKQIVPIGTKCGKCTCKARVIMEDELQMIMSYEKIA